MAYAGYLIKVGEYEIPADKYMKAGTYSPYVNMQVIDPYTDGNGYEHIDAVELKALKVEFDTPAMLTNTEFAQFMANIRLNYIESKSRKCKVTAYIPEYDDYFVQTAYMVDVKPTIYNIDGNVIHYNSVRIAFVGGVSDD